MAMVFLLHSCTSQKLAVNDIEPEDAKPIRFGDGCEGTLRTLDTSLKSEDPQKQLYAVRFEFKRTCNAEARVDFRFHYRVRKRAGGETVRMDSRASSGWIRVTDPGPTLIDSEFAIDLTDVEKGIAGPVYVSGIRAEVRDPRRE
jgi:hypothetical protein